MKRIVLGLVAALAFASPALAQNSTMNMGLTTGTMGMSGPTAIGGSLGDSAGSIAAGANSAVNASGNSFLNHPPGIAAPVAGIR